MRSIFVSILVMLCILGTSSAHANWDGDWNTYFLDFGNSSEVGAVDTDAVGNIYIAGSFNGTMRIVGGPLLAALGQNDVFVAKLSPTGVHIWSMSGGGPGSDGVTGIDVTPGGDVIVVGLTTSATFAFGGAAQANAGQTDGFATLFTSAGVHSWTKLYGGSFVDWVNSVDFRSNGNIVLAGQFRGTVNFGTGNKTSLGSSDFFLVEHTLAGATLAVQTGGGTGSETNPYVHIDSSGLIAFCGQFTGSINLGAGVMTSNGGQDIALTRFPSVGSAGSWSSSFGGTGNDFASALVTDADDTIYMTGGFQNTINLGTGNLTSSGDLDGYTAAYKSNGTPVWAQPFGGIDTDFGSRIVLDGSQLFVAANYQGTADFGGTNETASGNYDGILLELDTGGSWDCIFSVGGTNADFINDVVVSGTPIIVGSFTTSAAFGTLGINTGVAGPSDAYVVKLEVPTLTAAGDPPATSAGLVVGAAYPNPVRGRTQFAFQAPEGGFLQSAAIHDVAGRKVRTLESPAQERGLLRWDGRDDQGQAVGSGVYFLRVSDGTTDQRQRVTVIR